MSSLVPVIGGAVIAIAALAGGIANARRRGEPVPARDFVGPVALIALMGIGMFVAVQAFDGTVAILAILATAALFVAGFAWQQSRGAAGNRGRDV